MKLMSFIGFLIFSIYPFESEETCKTVDFSFNDEGRSCFTCSSDTESNCVTNPESANVCKCRIKSDKCVVGLQGTTTVRGCAMETTNLTKPEYCDTKNKCNLQDFQPKRLSCYQCKNCINAVNLQKCVKYLPDDQCYTEVLNDGNANRGCKSDLLHINEQIILCNSTGCNHDPSSTILSCILCNSNEYPECAKVDTSTKCVIDPVHTCKSKMLLGKNTRSACYTYKRFDYIERGCMKMQSTDPYGENMKLYDFCWKDFCNAKCINPIRCFVTPVNAGTKELDNIEAGQPKLCEGSFCHTCENSDGSLTRGCGRQSTNNSCTYCQGMDGCNSRNALRCYTCDSSKDPNCAQWSNPTAIQSEFCSNVEDICAIVIRGTDTIRGCFKPQELHCSNIDNNCMKCNTNFCNGGIFPENRRRCHMCFKTKDCVEAQDPKNSKICPNYDKNGACITFADTNNDMTRSCSTDLAAMKTCRSTGEPKCKICNTDGCNSMPLMLDPVLTCIKCKGPICAWGQRKDTALKCVNKFPYYLPETCITKVADRVVERGCTFDVGTCADDDCKMCDKDGCNIQMRASQKCVQCKSSNRNETSCKKSAEGIHGSNCHTEFMLYEQRGCYTKREDKVVIRGCASDLTSKILEDCKSDDNKLCDFCEGDNCNNSPAPNFGYEVLPKIEILGSMILLIAFFK